MNILKKLIVAKTNSVKAKIELNIFLLFSYIPFRAVPATAHSSPHKKQVRGIIYTLSHFSPLLMATGRMYSEIAVTQSINTFTFISCMTIPSMKVPVLCLAFPLFFIILIPR